jgi:hypothetical protein
MSSSCNWHVMPPVDVSGRDPDVKDGTGVRWGTIGPPLRAPLGPARSRVGPREFDHPLREEGG